MNLTSSWQQFALLLGAASAVYYLALWILLKVAGNARLSGMMPVKGEHATLMGATALDDQQLYTAHSHQFARASEADSLNEVKQLIEPHLALIEELRLLAELADEQQAGKQEYLDLLQAVVRRYESVYIQLGAVPSLLLQLQVAGCNRPYQISFQEHQMLLSNRGGAR